MTAAEPFPNIYSLDDIRQDILLIIIKKNRELRNKDKSSYLLCLIENRMNGRIARASQTPRLNWIFYLGDNTALTEKSSEYLELYRMFTDPFNRNCKYHDLNVVADELKKKKQEEKKD